MNRFVTLAALCVLGAAVIAAPASAASEKSQVQAYAKKKAAKVISSGPTGIGLTAKDIKAKCSDKGSYWKCSIDGNGGQCTGSLRVYGSPGDFSAPKKYIKVGCVADKAVAASIRPKSIVKYAKQVFKRKVQGGDIKLRNPISASCSTNSGISYSKCKVSASWAEGLCSGSLRVYADEDGYHARNIKVACSR